MNISVSPLLAQTAAMLIQSDDADKILDERKALTEKRNLLVNAYLNHYELLGDNFCPFRWIKLPMGYSSHSFELLANAANVRVFSADRFLVGTTLPYDAIRISVVSEDTDEKFEAGLQVLVHLLEHPGDTANSNLTLL